MLLLLGIGFSLFCLYKGKQYLQNNAKKWQELTELVGTRKYNRVKTFFVSLQMVLKLYWFQFVHNSVEHKDKRTIILSYVINGKIYKVVVSQKRGPVPVVLISDENGKDSTSDIIPYYGPNQDWHNRIFTPSFWNKEKLVFMLVSGETKTFQKDEPIII